MTAEPLAGRALLDAVIPIAEAEGVPALPIAALLWAENETMTLDSRRPHDPADDGDYWPDVSVGPFHQTIRSSPEWIAIARASGRDPAAYPGRATVDRIEALYQDVGHATRRAARQLKGKLDTTGYLISGDREALLDALCLYNKQVGEPDENPHRARYDRAIDEAAALLGAPAPARETTMTTFRMGNLDIEDLRHQLPHSYYGRSIGQIDDISIHHTVTTDPGEGATVGQELNILHGIGAYHTKKFRGYCYHLSVFSSGRCYYTGDFATVRYVVGGDRNLTNVAIAMIGTFTDVAPTPNHLGAVRRLIENVWMQMGRQLPVYGHREIAAEPTACPGATWESWMPALKAPIGHIPAPATGEDEMHAIRVQLDTLWGLADDLDDEEAALQRESIAAIKGELGMP